MRLFTAVGALAALILVSVSCDRGTDRRVGDDGVPGDNELGTEWVNDIPLYPQAEALSDQAVKDGVVSQSFATGRVAPANLMEWYETQLAADAWAPFQPVANIGVDTYRGIWVKDGAELTVSATVGPELEELRGLENATQFSLSLDPDTELGPGDPQPM